MKTVPARDAGVAFYIDQQLRGAWGTGAGQYRQGPWMEGTPEQGYQLNMTPQELYRVGIARTNNYCKERYGKTFDELSEADRIPGRCSIVYQHHREIQRPLSSYARFDRRGRTRHHGRSRQDQFK